MKRRNMVTCKAKNKYVILVYTMGIIIYSSVNPSSCRCRRPPRVRTSKRHRVLWDKMHMSMIVVFILQRTALQSVRWMLQHHYYQQHHQPQTLNPKTLKSKTPNSLNIPLKNMWQGWGFDDSLETPLKHLQDSLESISFEPLKSCGRNGGFCAYMYTIYGCNNSIL